MKRRDFFKWLGVAGAAAPAAKAAKLIAESWPETPVEWEPPRWASTSAIGSAPLFLSTSMSLKDTPVEWEPPRWASTSAIGSAPLFLSTSMSLKDTVFMSTAGTYTVKG